MLLSAMSCMNKVLCALFRWMVEVGLIPKPKHHITLVFKVSYTMYYLYCYNARRYVNVKCRLIYLFFACKYLLNTSTDCMNCVGENVIHNHRPARIAMQCPNIVIYFIGVNQLYSVVFPTYLMMALLERLLG